MYANVNDNHDDDPAPLDSSLLLREQSVFIDHPKPTTSVYLHIVVDWNSLIDQVNVAGPSRLCKLRFANILDEFWGARGHDCPVIRTQAPWIHMIRINNLLQIFIYPWMQHKVTLLIFCWGLGSLTLSGSLAFALSPKRTWCSNTLAGNWFLPEQDSFPRTRWSPRHISFATSIVSSAEMLSA